MALYNEIGAGRFNRMLQKHLSMKGSPPAPQLAGELSTNLQFLSGVENRYLEGWGLFGAGVVFNASVGNLNAARLRNPQASGVIMVVEQISFSAGATDEPSITTGESLATDLATVTPLAGNFFDRRWGARPSAGPVAILSSTQAAAPAALGGAFQWFRHLVLANTTLFLNFTDDLEFPILPGDALQVVNNVVNTGTRVMFRWRERNLEESERA